MNGYAKTPEAALRSLRPHLPAEMALYELLAGRLAQIPAPARRPQRQKVNPPGSASPERRAERHAAKVAQQRKKAKRKQSRHG